MNKQPVYVLSFTYEDYVSLEVMRGIYTAKIFAERALAKIIKEEYPEAFLEHWNNGVAYGCIRMFEEGECSEDIVVDIVEYKLNETIW